MQAPFFQSLDLPPELRCIVYEFVPIFRKHSTIPSERISRRTHDEAEAELTLAVNTLPLQLLRTCRQIHDEAKPILAPELELTRQSTPRITMNSEAWHCMAKRNGVLYTVMLWFGALKHTANASFDDWTISNRLTFWSKGMPFFHQAGLQLLARYQKFQASKTASSEPSGPAAQLFVGIKVRASPRRIREGVEVNPTPFSKRPGVEALNGMVSGLRRILPPSLQDCIGYMQDLPCGFFHIENTKAVCCNGLLVFDLQDTHIQGAETGSSWATTGYGKI